MAFPIVAHAECDDLVGFLNKEYPNRILVQTYGYTLERLVIFQRKRNMPGSSLSVVECVNSKYKTQKTFDFETETIADFEFDEMAGTVIVIFSADPPKVGYISRSNKVYKFTDGLYER